MHGHVTLLSWTPDMEAMIASGGRISTMDGTADEIRAKSLAAGKEENEKLKKMLKLAVKDLDFIRKKQGRICHFSFECAECPFSNGQNEGCVKNNWRYADKAKKLIGDDKND